MALPNYYPFICPKCNVAVLYLEQRYTILYDGEKQSLAHLKCDGNVAPVPEKTIKLALGDPKAGI